MWLRTYLEDGAVAVVLAGAVVLEHQLRHGAVRVDLVVLMLVCVWAGGSM